MARTKTAKTGTEATVKEPKMPVEVKEEPQEMVKEAEETIELDIPEEPQVKESKVSKEPESEKVDENVLPDYAKRVLKLFNNKPFLYVSSKGGAFDVDSKPSVRGSAILYKNPYYQSKQ